MQRGGRRGRATPAGLFARRRGIALGAALALGAVPAPAQAAVAWFRSPSGNIGCEVGWRRAGIGTYAYCQTGVPARSVRMNRVGTYRVCTGRACLGNPPKGVRTLAFGRSIRVGGFRCTSRRNGITCVVRATGRGFRIACQGVVRVG